MTPPYRRWIATAYGLSMNSRVFAPVQGPCAVSAGYRKLAMTAIGLSVTAIQQLFIHRQRLADDNFFVKLT
jgi:hypothetical protein